MSIVKPTISHSSRVLLAPALSATAIDSDAWPLIPLPYTPVVTPLAEDIIGMLAIDMSLVHNVFIRGVNSVWKNAPLIKPGDEVSFAGYCLALIEAIHGHHHGEETFIFPYLQTKLEMNENIEQHKLFHDGMDAFEAYMKTVFSKQDSYDAHKTRDLLKAFADPLVSHLHAEISTISPEKMQVFQDDPEGLQNMMHQLEEHIKNAPGKLVTFPFVVTHHDFTVAPNWPPAPRPLIWFARNVAPLRHPSYWRFSPFKPRGGTNATQFPFTLTTTITRMSFETAPLIDVNGFCFCQEHGWESCLPCSYDFTDLNNQACLVPDLPQADENSDEAIMMEEFDVEQRSQLNVYDLGAVRSNTRDKDGDYRYECSKHRKIDCGDCFNWVAIYMKEAKDHAKQQRRLKSRAKWFDRVDDN